MYIDTPHLLVTEYVTYKDRGNIAKLFKFIEHPHRYAEATSDGITFVDSYLEPTRSIQIVPPKGEKFQLGSNDVADILGRSPLYFGLPAKIAGSASGYMDKGVVFEATNDGDEPLVMITTFATLRKEDLGS